MFKSKRTVIRENEAQTAYISQLEARLSAMESEHRNLQTETQVLRAREESVVRALSEATAVAGKIKTEAENEANTMREKLQHDMEETKKETETLIEVAYQNARDIVREAEEQNRSKISEAEHIAQNYTSLLHQFHDLMRVNAEQAQQHAYAYAELIRRMQAELPPLSPEGAVSPVLEEAAIPIEEDISETACTDFPDAKTEENTDESIPPLSTEGSPTFEAAVSPNAALETTPKASDTEAEADTRVWKVDDVTANAILNASSDAELHALIDSILQRNQS